MLYTHHTIKDSNGNRVCTIVTDKKRDWQGEKSLPSMHAGMLGAPISRRYAVKILKESRSFGYKIETKWQS